MRSFDHKLVEAVLPGQVSQNTCFSAPAAACMATFDYQQGHDVEAEVGMGIKLLLNASCGLHGHLGNSVGS
jgi:hypothetical protein